MKDEYDSIEGIEHMAKYGAYPETFYQLHLVKDFGTLYTRIGKSDLYQTSDGVISNLEKIIVRCKE